ncbi:MAG: putative Na+/H+ antiporter [Verrucomicrobiales bacterium]
MRKIVIAFITSLLFFTAFSGAAFAAGGHGPEPAYHEGEFGLLDDQMAKFPTPLAQYAAEESQHADWGIWDKLKYRAGQQNGFNLVATIIFLCAIFHTFLAGYFAEIAHRAEKAHRERIEREGRTGCAKPHEGAKDDVSFRANLFHFLGEVEAIFGIWVIALAGAVIWFFGIQPGEGFMAGLTEFKEYIAYDVNFTEPLFVVIIMATAATRPVVRFAERLVDSVAQMFGGTPAAWWLSALTITPLLGSFITEPAAMTIAALLLSKKFFDLKPSPKFAYATLGLLFVNISVGGTLTHFAAPPVLMIAAKWNFGLGFMFMNFGWKAAVGIAIANALYFYYFKGEFKKLQPIHRSEGFVPRWIEREDPIPVWITVMHLIFLAWTVYFAHYPAMFVPAFLFLLAFSQATGHHQNEVDMKGPILVGFFLGGLVIHGGCQGWWISVLLTSIDNSWILMIGATVLTAFNDNAAITYLASQAPGLSISAKYAVVAGAVTGGGLTVIANAPNPAGQSILGRYFDGGVSPGKLVMAAIVPTVIMALCFMLFKTSGMTEDPLPPVEPQPAHSAPAEVVAPH